MEIILWQQKKKTVLKSNRELQENKEKKMESSISHLILDNTIIKLMIKFITSIIINILKTTGNFKHGIDFQIFLMIEVI